MYRARTTSITVMYSVRRSGKDGEPMEINRKSTNVSFHFQNSNKALRMKRT